MTMEYRASDGTSTSRPLSAAQASSQRRGQKDDKDQKLGRTRVKQCLVDMTGPLHS